MYDSTTEHIGSQKLQFDFFRLKGQAWALESSSSHFKQTALVLFCS
jgi:hypothetical protein